ncbi:hypothetical protein D1007_20606 [Hordeum vulgare]|nr:hypothetical protein D1007_20606 [Hordeum vulgare]
MHISSSLQPSHTDPMEVVDAEWEFAIIVKVDNYIRKMDLSVVYTNNLVFMENSINTSEHLLDENGNYKVVGFDLEYTDNHVGHDHMVVVA